MTNEFSPQASASGLPIAALLAELGGQLLVGNPAQCIDHPAHPDQPAAVNAQSMLFAESASALAQALAARPGLVVTASALADQAIQNPADPTPADLATADLAQAALPPQVAVVVAEQPRLWFAQAAQRLRPSLPPEGIHPAAVVAADAVLAADVTVGACAVVGSGVRIGARTRVDAGVVLEPGVIVGSNCHLRPRVVVYSGTTLGNRVHVHAGAVLGADGFGYVRDRRTGRYTQFPQQGTLHIEDDVEIGANSTVDRGALAETRIARGTKLDNLVHIGHNCTIGEDVVMASLCGISGSSSIGNGAILAGQVGIGDHVTIGPGVILGGQAGVLSGKTVTTTGTVLWGTPARPLRQYLRELATLTRLARKPAQAREE